MPTQNEKIQIVIAVDPKDLKSGGAAAINEISKIGKAYENLKKSQNKLNKVDYARGLFDVRPHREIRREITQLGAAYNRLKNSGKLTISELYQAQKRLRQQTADLRKQMNGLDKDVAGISGRVKGLVGAYLGFATVRSAIMGLITSTSSASTANFNLESSVAAANREFDNTGSLEEWIKHTRQMSEELRIYSESDIKLAVSRTIDMTKRLGLNSDQMAVVIRRTADLSAGRTDLVGGIERVTAALRGEAEASEFLGLTLNENYVKAWHETHNVHAKAWKDLNDLEKAQVRLEVLLEQSAPAAGRAAASIKTLAGAWQYMESTIDNAIANNDDVKASLERTATVIRENAPALAEFAKTMAKVLAATVSLVVENKNSILSIAGLVLTVKTATASYKTFKNTMDLLKAVNLGKWAATGAKHFRTLTAALAASRLGMLGVAGAVGLFSVASVTKAISEYMKMREAIDDANAAEERLLETVEKTKKKFEDFKDVEIPSDLATRPKKELEELRRQLAKTKAYWTSEYAKWSTAAEKTTYAGTLTFDAEKAVPEAEKAAKRLREINEALKTIQNSHKGVQTEQKKTGTIGKAVYAELAEEAKESFKKQTEAAEKWAAKVIGLDEKIRNQRQSTEDKLRALSQQGMGEMERWEDNQALGDEKAATAEAELKKAQQQYALAMQRQDEANKALAQVQVAAASGDLEALNQARAVAARATQQAEDATAQTEVHFERAMSYAEQAEEVYNRLATAASGKDQYGLDASVTLQEGIDAAKSGVASVGTLQQQILQTQRAQAVGFAATANQSAAQAKAAFESVSHQTMDVEIQTPNLDSIRSQLAELTRDETKTIHIRTAEAHALGGPVGIGYRYHMRRGGRLPGADSKIDKVPVLARPGEWFIRNEAVSVWNRAMGSGFMHAVNAPWSGHGQRLLAALKNASLPGWTVDMPDMSGLAAMPMRFATGGMVPSGGAHMGTIELAIGGGSFAVQAPVDTLKALNKAIKRAKRTG